MSKDNTPTSTKASPKRDLDKPLHIALCTPGTSFTQGFVESFSDSLGWLERSPHTYWHFTRGGANLPRVRNQLALGTSLPFPDAKPFGGMEYDVAVWIDSDMVWTPADLERLVSHDVDVVGGIYLTAGRRLTSWWDLAGEQSKYPTTAWVKDYVRRVQLGEAAELIPVDGIGFGLLAMKRGVLERLGYPWFWDEMVEFEDGRVELVGEDYTFTRECQKKAIKIHLDPQLQPWHEKRVRLGIVGSRPEADKKADEHD